MHLRLCSDSRFGLYHTPLDMPSGICRPDAEHAYSPTPRRPHHGIIII